MIPAVLTFAMVLAVILIAYYLAVVRPERQQRSALITRLQPPRTQAAAVRATILREATRLSTVPAFNRLLVRRDDFAKPIGTLIEQAGVKMTVGTLLLSSGCLGLAALILVSRLSGSFLAGLALGALAAWIPTIYLRTARNKRVRKFEDLFPEALDLITRAMRAGHAFTTGLAMVAEEMPAPIGPEFKLLYDRQNFGLPLPEALRDFAERIPLLDARFFATAVLTQREAGGNLSEVLDNLASVMRERFSVKRQVRVKSAHGRMTGWILSALPPSLAVAIFFVAPNNLKMLVTDPLGQQMVIGAIVLQVAGTLVIRRLVDIEY